MPAAIIATGGESDGMKKDGTRKKPLAAAEEALPEETEAELLEILANWGGPAKPKPRDKAVKAPVHYSREKVKTGWRPPPDAAEKHLREWRRKRSGAKEIMTFALAFCVGMCLILFIVYVVALGPERKQLIVGRGRRRTDLGMVAIILFGAATMVVVSLVLAILAENKKVAAWFSGAGQIALIATGSLSGAGIAGAALWLLW